MRRDRAELVRMFNPSSWFHPSVCSRPQGVENAVCILRNLSYQLYNEIPPSIAMRLEGPTRDQSTGKGDAIGCFTPNSRKAKNVRTRARTRWKDQPLLCVVTGRSIVTVPCVHPDRASTRICPPSPRWLGCRRGWSGCGTLR